MESQQKKEKEQDDGNDKKIKQFFRIWQSSAQAQQIQLGLLINIFEGDDEDEEYEELEDEDFNTEPVSQNSKKQN